MNAKVFLAVLLGIAATGIAGAHEFFVIPQEARNYKAGEAIPLDVLSTHYFMAGEEIETPASVNDVYVLQSGLKTSLSLTPNQRRLLYETSYTLKDNTPAVLVGNRAGAYYCIFTDGTHAEGKRSEVTKANPQKTIARSHFYAKFSKTYLNPDIKDTAYKNPLGQTLEIVPLSNPAEITKGKNAEFQVLYKGQPLGNAEVSATYNGYDQKNQNSYALTGKTKQSGRVRFKINQSGVWLVRVSDTRRGDPGVDVQELTAIVVFTVK
ncbi:MAG: DUF4198 domain-containing protein [Treponema sp.]|jgi:uncharacterized GH25 family protein|nr:DUF4198 domain-containing protein [Treponema sp.]